MGGFQSEPKGDARAHVTWYLHTGNTVGLVEHLEKDLSVGRIFIRKFPSLCSGHCYERNLGGSDDPCQPVSGYTAPYGYMPCGEGVYIALIAATDFTPGTARSS